jgi:hypothetical protein
MADDEPRVPRLESAPEAEPTPDDEPLRLGQPRSPALPAKEGGHAEPGPLDLDEDRVDAVALAVLLLTAHQQGKGEPWRVWKGIDWDAADRLHEKGYIADPKSKAKSVVVTEAGYERGRELLRRLCGRGGGGHDRSGRDGGDGGGD